MSLSVGIVGLPNAGKSTLFNALASRRLAETASRPFTTIEPHEAVVGLPDEKLEKLSKLINPEKTIQADITFIDIAGLVKGAHKGEGLGNQFLAKIREVDAIVHVVRAFKDDSIIHQDPTHEPGTPNQIIDDIEIINLELELGGVEEKPTIIVLNTNEGLLFNEVLTDLGKELEEKYNCEFLLMSAKLEEDLIDLEPDEGKAYLKELGIDESVFEGLIKKAFKLLQLIKFYTVKGGKEVSAWSLKEGSSAIEAAGTVHTDFADNFIKAEVINVEELLEVGGWKEAKEKGKIGLEGRDYIVKDGDVIEFKIGT
jgi:small GTP-binding protein